MRDAIADVRNDKTPTNWVLAAYHGDNSNDVGLVGHGEGGVNELIHHLKDSIYQNISPLTAHFFCVFFWRFFLFVWEFLAYFGYLRFDILENIFSCI